MVHIQRGIGTAHTAVCTNKHVTDDVRRSASESIQGKIVPPETNMKTDSESKENRIVKGGAIGDESDLDDFVPNLKDI